MTINAMENEFQQSSTSLPNVSTPVPEHGDAEKSPAPVLTTTHAKRPFPLGFVMGGVLLFLFIFVLMLIMQNKQSSNVPRQTDTTPTLALPSPTPIRKASVLSTSAAFGAFSSEKASFSAELNTFTFQEGLYTPPILDLDLGIVE